MESVSTDINDEVGSLISVDENRRRNMGILDFFSDWTKDKINKKTKTKYDLNGLDWCGFNKDGFRAGWDRNGFGHDGLNKYGYNINGFDNYGYTKEGTDKEGFDKNGYGIDGVLVQKRGV